MKKRLFSFVLALMMLAAAVPIGVFAEEEDADANLEDAFKTLFTVETVTVDIDDEIVQINISVSRNGGIAGMNYQLLYNTDALILEQQPVLGDLDGFEYTGGPLEEGRHVGMLYSSENVVGNGVLLTYTFKINPNAEAKTYDIQLFTSEGVAALPDGGTVKLEVFDENFKSISTVVKNGSVTIPGYVISFDANGGEGAPDSQKKSKNTPIYLSSVVPKRSGYSFQGWSTEKDAQTAEYKAGGKYSANASAVLYAVWEKEEIIAGSIDLIVSKTEAKAGDEVEVTVSVDNHLGFRGLDFYITYDHTKLDYLSYEKKMAFSGIDEVSDPDKYENKVDCNIIAANASNVVDIGELITFKFKVLEEAEDGFTDVSLVVNDAFCLYGPNMEETTLATNVTNGGVEIISQLLGDINLDEVVDMNDAILLLQYSLFPDMYPVDYKGDMDFNKDGYVDMNDAILILQFSLFPDLYPLA